MSVSAFASGTQSATVTTEHFLSSPNVAGQFTLHVDTINMVAGDVVELRVYQMVLTGGTQRVAYLARYVGAQAVDDYIKVSVAIPNELTDTNSLRFSLTQTFGTSRNFPWKVLNIDTALTDTSGVTTLLSRLSALRAGYLDNLSAGAVALESSLQTVDNYVDTEIADILVDTSTTLDDLVDDLESRLTAALATKLSQHAAGVLALVVGVGSTTGTVVFSTVEGAAPSAVDNFYNGRVIVFTSGALSGQAVEITGYTGATTTATISTATGSAANTVTGVIV